MSKDEELFVLALEEILFLPVYAVFLLEKMLLSGQSGTYFKLSNNQHVPVRPCPPQAGLAGVVRPTLPAEGRNQQPATNNQQPATNNLTHFFLTLSFWTSSIDSPVAKAIFSSVTLTQFYFLYL